MLTRLDCMLGSAALMRMALAQALHHARHRSAFGKRLVEQPLMRNVLADLAIESEAALALSMRVARAVDAAPRDAARSRVRAHRHRDRQVLDLQARAGLRQRGAGMPRRRRLRRGIDAAAPVPAGAAELDLGRQRQHPVPRRVARACSASRRRARRSSPNSSRRGPACRARCAIARLAPSLRDPDEAGRAPAGRAHGAGVAGVACCCVRTQPIAPMLLRKPAAAPRTAWRSALCPSTTWCSNRSSRARSDQPPKEPAAARVFQLRRKPRPQRRAPGFDRRADPRDHALVRDPVLRPAPAPVGEVEQHGHRAIHGVREARFGRFAILELFPQRRKRAPCASGNIPKMRVTATRSAALRSARPVSA